jgi:ABC-2 type transport system permease protein
MTSGLNLETAARPSQVSHGQDLATMRNGAFGESAWVAWRSLKKLTRNPFLIFFSLFMPLIWLMLFSQTFGVVFARGAAAGGFTLPYDYVAVMLPGVVIMTAIQSASQSGFGMVADIDSGFMDKFFVAPIGRTSVLFGKILADGTRMAVQSSIVLTIAWVMTFIVGWRIPFAAGFFGAVLIVLLATGFGIAFSGLSNTVALRTKNTETTMLVSFTLTFPLQFLSTALIPKELLPHWVQVFSTVNPVSYISDAARSLIITGFNWTTIGEAVLAIAIFGVVLQGLAIQAFRAQGK